MDLYHRFDVYPGDRHIKLEKLNATTGVFMWRQVSEKFLGLQECAKWSSMPSFEYGVLRVVNNSSERDTAGALAGAILGAYWGENGIPLRWKAKVDRAKMIVELADELIVATKR